MTGKLPIRSGLYGVKTPVFWPNSNGGIPGETQTIAEGLKNVGYDTAMIGKWHLGDKADALPTRHGFDRWIGTPYSNDMNPLTEPEYEKLVKKITRRDEELTPEERKRITELAAVVMDPKRKSSDWNVPLIVSRRQASGYTDKVIELPVDQELLTKRYTEEAVSYIKTQAESDKPFFLYLAYNMPHTPTFASKQFKGKSLRGTYGDAVEEIDWSVDEIRRALEEVGLAANTLVVFSSDNGGADTGSNGPLKGRKALTYEGGGTRAGYFLVAGAYRAWCCAWHW